MRKNIKVPRILKIEKIDGFNITCMFSNGESRVIDFKAVFQEWKLSENDVEYPLIEESEFKRVELRNQTLSWSNIKVVLLSEDGVAEVHPYDIDPVTLFELSQASYSNEVLYNDK